MNTFRELFETNLEVNDTLLSESKAATKVAKELIAAIGESTATIISEGVSYTAVVGTDQKLDYKLEIKKIADTLGASRYSIVPKPKNHRKGVTFRIVYFDIDNDIIGTLKTLPKKSKENKIKKQSILLGIKIKFTLDDENNREYNSANYKAYISDLVNTSNVNVNSKLEAKSVVGGLIEYITYLSVPYAD
ncbi:MAG: hypothetical protein J7L15_03265 [Clostridiales bacterium]|nr:hypothetical protein [Clostridiales bacterium]